MLAGAKVPREQAEPVPVAALINAAASEVEDYTRVVTATVPDSEVARLGRRRPRAPARRAARQRAALLTADLAGAGVGRAHGNGGLVIEVSDIGLGMTESDLRVANTRLQSGGEVDPYTARHMGLFVVGRLAAQHGLVVRLRSTVAGEPNSGTTAGVYVPAELLRRAGQPHQFSEPEYAMPADAHAGIATVLALDEDHGQAERDTLPGEPEHLNGHSEVPVSLLPQRNPGASGISDLPASLVAQTEVHEEEWPAGSMPVQIRRT